MTSALHATAKSAPIELHTAEEEIGEECTGRDVHERVDVAGSQGEELDGCERDEAVTDAVRDRVRPAPR